MTIELTPNEARVLKDALEYDILAQLDVAQAVGLDNTIRATDRDGRPPVDEDDIRVMYCLYDKIGGCSSVVQKRYRTILGEV